VFVVDHQVGATGGQLGDQLGGDLGVDVPVAGLHILRPAVTRLEGTGREQLDGNALRLQLEGAGGNGGFEGVICLHAASVGGMAGAL